MEFIRYEEKGRVGIITLSREESLNALCTPMLREIDKLLDEIDTDEICFPEKALVVNVTCSGAPFLPSWIQP